MKKEFISHEQTWEMKQHLLKERLESQKNKAVELTNKFLPHVRWNVNKDAQIEIANLCVLILLDEVIKAIPDADYDKDKYINEVNWWRGVKAQFEY